jgi:hypothetical protein
MSSKSATNRADPHALDCKSPAPPINLRKQEERRLAGQARLARRTRAQIENDEHMARIQDSRDAAADFAATWATMRVSA